MKKEERKKLKKLLKKLNNNKLNDEEYCLIVEQIENIIINDFANRGI